MGILQGSRMKTLCAASVVCPALALALAAPAADWPQWRGPERTGVARDARLPAAWPKEPPKPAWRVSIGEGYSSPVIADGRLFILGRISGDREVCYCLDAASGKELWKHAYAAPYTPADPSAGKGPKSTPAVDGDRVYAYGVAGMLHCLTVKD